MVTKVPEEVRKAWEKEEKEEIEEEMDMKARGLNKKDFYE